MERMEVSPNASYARIRPEQNIDKPDGPAH